MDGEMVEYFRRTEEEMYNFLAAPDPYRDGMNTPHISMESYGRDCGCFECQPVAVYGGNNFDASYMYDGNNNAYDPLGRGGYEDNGQLVFGEDTLQFDFEAFRSNSETQNENDTDNVPDNNII